MKTIILLSFILPASLGLTVAGVGRKQANKIPKWETDTIYKADVPYGLLLHKGPNAMKEYSIRTLSNNEIAYAKYDANAKDAAGFEYYRFTFLGSGAVAHYPLDTKMDTRIANAVVENELIGDSAVNPAGERRFLLIYPLRPTLQHRDNRDNCDKPDQ